jgi:hypothetical protein
MSSKLVEYFNRMPRIGTLSTAGKDGTVDSAVIGSARMQDERTVTMGLRNNRTFANLKENPHAVFTIVEPGKNVPDWKGVRVYLTMQECRTQGPLLDAIKTMIATHESEEAAVAIHAAAIFRVTEIRPLVDFGQGWEKSI